MDRYIGVMSGTSMDAVDIALVGFDDECARLLARHSENWPPTLRERLASAAAGAPLDATALTILDSDTGLFLADAIQRFLDTLPADRAPIVAIGCHGQTVAHSPDTSTKATLQLGDASRIVERTGITTVNDFRRRDLAAGGQGAPLAPAFHRAMLHSDSESRVIVNLGGIANITVLPADPQAEVTGFDTGPANCLMDLWSRQHLGEPFDAGGEWAASAAPDQDLLATLLADPYFALPAPKSTGTQYFSRAWLQTRLGQSPQADPARVQATLLALTTTTLADAMHRHAPNTQRVLACGGGANNGALLERLSTLLDLPVESTAAHGIDPAWVEAMAFAWLARETLERRPGNLASVTGAAGPRLLGAVHFP